MHQSQPTAVIVLVRPRGDALANGDLVDVTAPAARAGFPVPVAISRSAYHLVAAALDDALAIVHYYASAAPPGMRVSCTLAGIGGSLRVEAGSGFDDNGDPCFTISLPGEEWP